MIELVEPLTKPVEVPLWLLVVAFSYSREKRKALLALAKSRANR